MITTMETADCIAFPELWGTILSADDQRLLDEWEAEGDAYETQLDSRLTAAYTDQDSSDSEIDSAIDTDTDTCSDDDDESDDSDGSDDDDIDLSDTDGDEQSDSDSGLDSQSDEDTDSSDSDSDDDEHSDTDTDDCASCRRINTRMCRIRPIRRRKWVARPIRVQLLKRFTLLASRYHVCCRHRCCDDWKWVRNYDVYADFDD